jgi:hypothetical protein
MGGGGLNDMVNIFLNEHSQSYYDSYLYCCWKSNMNQLSSSLQQIVYNTLLFLGKRIDKRWCEGGAY